MEFICVISVSGSLASYRITKQSNTAFTASLQSGNGKRQELPERIVLTKEAEGWKANPWHDEIVPSLTHAIDSSIVNGG